MSLTPLIFAKTITYSVISLKTAVSAKFRQNFADAVKLVDLILRNIFRRKTAVAKFPLMLGLNSHRFLSLYLKLEQSHFPCSQLPPKHKFALPLMLIIVAWTV